MSSGAIAGGIIAAAVAIPGSVIYGAGWLAWQAGKLVVDVNRAADGQIAEKMRQKEAAANHRMRMAVAAHDQLVDVCGQVLNRLDSCVSKDNAIGLAELEQLRYELNAICQAQIPDDASALEKMTTVGYLKLDSIVRKQKNLAAMEVPGKDSGLYRGLSVADIMDDLRVAIAAMEIIATEGADIKATDPAVMERVALNKRFTAATAKVVQALENISALASTGGLNTSASAWYHSCFDGIDQLIEALYQPAITNEALKKGVLRIEDALEQYTSMTPHIERKIRQMAALYQVYAQTAKALQEPVEAISRFQSPADIEEKLKALQVRVERAKKCAEIYKKLGAQAYLCYAWDQELAALGYQVHSRQKIEDMAQEKQARARLGKAELPFYLWKEKELTQLYAITEQCALQVVVHEDGTVFMKTIADGNEAGVVQAQRAHCEQLKVLYARLRQNWFIFYDYEETEAPEEITTVAKWRQEEKKPQRKVVPKKREEEKKKQKKQYL